MSDLGNGEMPSSTPALSPSPIEARARRMGWSPRENWRGDASRWVDASTYVERAESSFPVLQERYAALDSRFQKTEAELAGTRERLNEVLETVQQQTEVLDEFRIFASKGEERAYNRARREIEGKMAQAVAEADTVGFNAAREELNELGAPPAAPTPRQVVERKPPETPAAVATPAPAAPAAPAADTPIEPAPELKTWMTNNMWFVQGSPVYDRAAASFAITEDTLLAEEQPTLSVADRLVEVTRRVKARFPKKFGITSEDEEEEPPPNPARQRAVAVTPQAVTPPSNGATRDKRSYANLPKADREICDRFCRTIPNFTKEEFLSQYVWDE